MFLYKIAFNTLFKFTVLKLQVTQISDIFIDPHDTEILLNYITHTVNINSLYI